jgi:hypothetical protein
MLTIQQIQEEAYATALEKGWHDRPLRESVETHSYSNENCYRTVVFRDRFSDQRGDVTCTCPRVTTINHDRVLAKHALMHTELTEMHECLDGNDLALRFAGETTKPEGLAVEAADAVIRIADTAAALDIMLDVQLDNPYLKSANKDSRGAAFILLARARQVIDRASEAARVDDWINYAANLSLAISFIASICASLDLDLGTAIEAKTTYNKTRPHRHGGKRA